MTDSVEISNELEEWASLAGYALTPASRAHDGRALFWSSGGEIRLFLGSRPDGWFVITRSERFGEEQLTFAAARMSTIEKYLFGNFGHSVRSIRGLPVIPVLKSSEPATNGLSIQPRQFDGAARLALIAPDGSIIALKSGGKLIATSSLAELSALLSATIEDIKASFLAPAGSPLFNSD